MKHKYRVLITLMLIMVLVLSACSQAIDMNEYYEDDIEALKVQVKQLKDQLNELKEKNEELLKQTSTNSTSSQSLWDIGQEVIELIKDKNMVELSTYVHSTKGINFSPYYLDIPQDQVFTAEELAALTEDTTKYTWGYYIGPIISSEIILDFNDYYEEFIYDDDYINANMIGVNGVVSYGTTDKDIIEQFPNAEYIEFYIQHSPHYEGTHWKSLKLVFEKENGQYKLIAIIHGEWHDIYGVD